MYVNKHVTGNKDAELMKKSYGKRNDIENLMKNTRIRILELIDVKMMKLAGKRL